MNSLHNTNRRLGVTLIEMLVVVAIMMFMLTIAAPMFRPDQDGAVARDTARALNAYIQEARAKAIATGRPCGVAFIPFDKFPSACVVAQQVECPPLYTGDTYQSKVTVKQTESAKSLDLEFIGDVSDKWTKSGNMIRLGSRGMWYEMTGPTGCKIPDYLVDQQEIQLGPDADFRPWTEGDWTTTYEIQAVPVTKADNYLQSVGMAEPLKVVRGSAIDLSYSGVGDSGVFSNTATNPIIIMFTPTGEVGYCYRIIVTKSGGRGGKKISDAVPPGKVYILCGQWDRALSGYTPEDGLLNYQTLDSYWVVIDPATGNSTIEQNIQYNAESVTAARKFN